MSNDSPLDEISSHKNNWTTWVCTTFFSPPPPPPSSQVLGFAVGPALQTAVSPLGNDGTSLMGLPMNMYTAAGWINVLMGILNLALFLPWSFKEHKIAAREAMRDQGKASGNLDHLFILAAAAADAPVPRGRYKNPSAAAAAAGVAFLSLNLMPYTYLLSAAEKETWKSMKPDYLASWTLICVFFVLVFNFVLLET